MKSAVEELRKLVGPPWIVYGYGPQFSNRHLFDLTKYRKFGAAYTCIRAKLDAAHFFNLEDVRFCREALLLQKCPAVLPWHPHLDGVPHNITLSQRIRQLSWLKELDQKGLIWAYNDEASVRRRPHPFLANILDGLMDGPAMACLLVTAGIKNFGTLGFDRNDTISHEFSKVQERIADQSLRVQSARINRTLMNRMRVRMWIKPLGQVIGNKTVVTSQQSRRRA